MGKGSAGWPSKTGNPSGKGRDNNPPYYDDDSDSYGPSIPISSTWSSFNSTYPAQDPSENESVPEVRLSAEEEESLDQWVKERARACFDAAREIRTARESGSESQAVIREQEIRAKLTKSQNLIVSRMMAVKESARSKMLRGK